MNGGFLRLKLVGDESREQIDHEVCRASMPAVFDLLGVFQLVIDGFDDTSFSEHELIPETHEVVLHVSSDAGDEDYTFL